MLGAGGPVAVHSVSLQAFSWALKQIILLPLILNDGVHRVGGAHVPYVVCCTSYTRVVADCKAADIAMVESAQESCVSGYHRSNPTKAAILHHICCHHDILALRGKREKARIPPVRSS